MKFTFAKCWNNKGPRRDKQTKKLETRGSSTITLKLRNCTLTDIYPCSKLTKN